MKFSPSTIYTRSSSTTCRTPIVGKKKEDALKMGEIFLKMIQGEASEDEIDSLEEASALRDIAHMPARVKCAVLGWRTLKEALLDGDELS